jgi:N-acetyl-anhydromuramyl-L-alanine amidase AmpD
MNRRAFMVSSAVAASAIAAGMLYWDRRWNYIIVHHSGGSYGHIPFLQKVHRNRQAHDPIDAIPYHYIIGNGNGLALGEVASDWRQRYNLWGAHMSARNMDRNFRGIGICLIGNYESEQVPARQYGALVRLTRDLMLRYSIPVENVTGHGWTPGEQTKCPGKNFPMRKFLSDIASQPTPRPPRLRRFGRGAAERKRSARSRGSRE